MSKKNDAKLRRQLEILKAQLRTSTVQKGAPAVNASPETQKNAKEFKKVNELDIAKIKTDLLRTIIFSAFSFAAILALYLTQNRWLSFIKFV
ncbi:hypothetical protein HY419_01005 [candidate division WWE3 bacterium]|nr:hypothetical protein [candidate division WWE3 bacterium]